MGKETWNPDAPWRSIHTDIEDGTDRLCEILYGRKAVVGDWVGGANAKTLHDASDELEAAREAIEAVCELNECPICGGLMREDGSGHNEVCRVGKAVTARAKMKGEKE